MLVAVGRVLKPNPAGPKPVIRDLNNRLFAVQTKPVVWPDAVADASRMDIGKGTTERSAPVPSRSPRT